MGCDIHCYAEIHKAFGDEPKKWYKLGYMFKYPYVEKDDIVIDHGDGDIHCVLTDRCYSGRNYGLFGILAGVRGEATPIAEPRGVPTDASEGYKKVLADWGVNAHTPSWYTLFELLKPKTYAKLSVSPEFQKAMLNLRKKLKEYNTKDIRIVFFFDN